MSTDSAISIAWDVLKCLVAPLKRGFSYVMSSKSYADNLRKEVGNLEYEAERIRHAAEGAENNLRSIHGWVGEFLASAEKASIEAGDLLGEFEKASRTCCHRTLPDPNCRYQFSRKANHKTGDLKNLILECSNREISFSGPAPGDVAALIRAGREGKDVVQSTTTAASASSVDFESRALMIRNIMDALVDNRYSVVGVHGMGGVGKSTLLVDAEKRIREKNSFDWVAKADVSQNPDVKKIQEEIAHWLGLSDIKKEDTVSLRAKLLRERLEDLERKKNKVLIILDNLWEQLDLKVVGIPCGVDNKVIGCKMLLTSRDRNVLQRDMACDKEFPLDMLEENEARTLFERMVGDKVHDDEFRTLVDEALRKCARLPLLIVTMAKHFKNAGLSEWRDALNQIERCSNEGVSAVINKMLQLSYDHLKSEEAKSLLQLCVTYGVSEPSLENLMRYGNGLGIFPKDSSMNEARDRLNTLIRTLQASSLLLDNGGTDRFKIHDLVHDFVAEFVLRDRLLLVSKDKDMSATQLQNERLKSCSAICFPYIDMEESPKEIDCSELRIFLLFNNNPSLLVSNSYFNSMRKLAVIDLTRIILTCSPTPFQFLENLHTLCLRSCLVEDVAILGKLKGLQILSFMNSSIERLPKEIGQLVELRLLDLNNCLYLQKIEPGVLGRLIKLEELYMENSFNKWNPMEQTQPTNASLIELNHMKNLCTLHVLIPDPSVLPKDLNVKKLSKYNIQIGNTWYRWSRYKGLRTLELTLNSTSDVIQKGCIQSFLSKTDNLYLEELNETEQSICALSQEGPIEASKLERVQVSKASWFWEGSLNITIQNMFEEVGTFAGAKNMLLSEFPKLIGKWHNELNPIKSYWQLESLVVDKCPSFVNAIPSKLMLVLNNLYFLQVRDCEVLEEIFDLEGLEAVESTRVLPQLWELNLVNLPQLRRLWNKDLQELLCFNSLKNLILYNCSNLGHAFSPSMARCLANLELMEIKECGQMEGVIVEEEGEGSAMEKITFPKLKRMTMEYLPNLTCFLLGKNHMLECATLQVLKIAHCLEMRSLIRQSWMENDHGTPSLFTLQPVIASRSSPPRAHACVGPSDYAAKLVGYGVSKWISDAKAIMASIRLGVDSDEEKFKNLLFNPLFLLLRPQPPDLCPSSVVANGGVTDGLIRLTLAMSKPSMASFLRLPLICLSHRSIDLKILSSIATELQIWKFDHRRSQPWTSRCR
ncbi:disease resistance protein At4g27190 [Eucalyptus grandis]|uniref:disease resistance protein At4g27190 n=1 Tax=Eucalyptus grandis TaxID=71139 RepID=UPI00192EEEF3|nr:disease resistance protein At4g27190 [Eucalyptus grandis]